MKSNLTCYCIALFLLNLNSAYAEQLSYRCKYATGFTEYSIDTSSNTVREYIPHFQHVRTFPLQFITPATIVWESKTKTKYSKFNILYELNRHSLELKEYALLCDYTSGKCDSPIFKIKCYNHL